jgi:hypothetical protein
MTGPRFPEADFWPGTVSGLLGSQFSMSVINN